MTARRLDFDSFRRERSGEPVVVSVGGVDYLLPASLPAATALDIIELNKSAVPCEEHAPKLGDNCEECVNPDATPEQIFKMADPLFGPGVLRQIAADHQLDVDELGNLIIQTFQLYSEAPAPNRAARRAAQRSRTRSSRQARTSG